MIACPALKCRFHETHTKCRIVKTTIIALQISMNYKCVLTSNIKFTKFRNSFHHYINTHSKNEHTNDKTHDKNIQYIWLFTINSYPPVGSGATEGVLSEGYMNVCPDQVLHQNHVPVTRPSLQHGGRLTIWQLSSCCAGVWGEGPCYCRGCSGSMPLLWRPGNNLIKIQWVFNKFIKL